MTYCAAALVDEGIVFVADSRTNAGVDNVSVYRKMTVYERAGERVLVLLTAGNLAITQAVLEVLAEAPGGPTRPGSLYSAATMPEAAQRVGDAIRAVYQRDAASLKEHGIEFLANFILGGQIADGEPRLYQVYAAGNHIEASRETPYFQIGESKYGKPVIDRVVRAETTLNDVAKCLLISMDSTLRSNLSVGLPLDIALYRRDDLHLRHRVEIGEDDPYFQSVRSSWGEALAKAFREVPNPPWA